MLMIEDDDNKSSELPVTRTKLCRTCNKTLDESNFRTYGKGRRAVCIECEKESEVVEKEIDLNEALVIKSSLGFSAMLVNEDTYTISQEDAGEKNTIKLQPHEAVELVAWLKVRLYPEEE